MIICGPFEDSRPPAFVCLHSWNALGSKCTHVHTCMRIYIYILSFIKMPLLMEARSHKESFWNLSTKVLRSSLMMDMR